MAVPFRRTSKTRKRLRRSHLALTMENLVTCSNCGAAIRQHHVCPSCGYYNGKLIPGVIKQTKEKEDGAK